MCAPKAPSPTATAQAQTQGNMIGQNTPYGTLSYSQTGTFSNGQPQYTATQTLSPAQQQLLNTSQNTSQNLANVAQEQSGRLSGLLNTPLDWSQQQNYLNDITNQSLDRSWDRQAQQTETDLINRGIRPGSTQYQQQIGDFRNDRSMAYNNANVQNYNTALQSQLALRNQPLNEILALSGQSQIQNPNFVNTPQTDTAGIINQGYQQQMQGYQNQQGMLGGLFSAGASLIPLFSDARLKTNIVEVGRHPDGFGIYEYDRIDTGDHERGVIAQEVMQFRPDAVDDTHESGMLRVHYWRL